jgi:2-polyprenyl-6-methoxyphenol hydroxylase-like FAD-dependent oxidoreductase
MRSLVGERTAWPAKKKVPLRIITLAAINKREPRKDTNMGTNKTIDVLIVGAGPTGLTLAYQLRRLGLSFRIIEKNATRSSTSKAIGLQYRVSEVLTWMGLFDRFRTQGVAGTGINFFANGERMLHLRLDQLDNTSGQGAFAPESIVIPQSVTEGLLIDALHEQGVAIEYCTTFVSFTQDADRVIARLKTDDGEELIEARYLVSCEGAHSLIRKQAGIAFEGKYLIRPDGYVGLFQRPLDEYALRSYMTKLFTADALEVAFAAPELGAPLGNRA